MILEVIMLERFFFTILLLIGFFSPDPLSAKSVLPNEFGELVPLYSSMQVVETRYTRESILVQFSSDDSYDKVYDYYLEALKNEDWRILQVEEVGVIKAEKVAQGKNNITLSIKKVFSKVGQPSSFIIDLYYPGGRE